MKKNVLLFLMLFAIAPFISKAQDLPQPSPKASVSQKVGLTNFTIEYSRPGMKNRTIFGDLVPFGKIWRTGANKATSIEFDTEVTFEGNKVTAGKYAIFTIPGKEKWEVIISKDVESWGAGDYKKENDVARFFVQSQPHTLTETMQFSFDNVTDHGSQISLTWAETRVVFNVKVDAKATALKNIEKAIKEAQGTFRVYNSSARYYLTNNLDSKKALEWALKSVEMSKKFWNLKTLSEAYAANKDYKNALKTAEESLKMSTEAKYDPYIKMNQENIEKWKKMK